MFEDAVAAFRDIFSAPFRVALYKSLGLTVLILIAAGVGLDRFVANAVASAYPWLGAALAILAGVGLFIGLGFLIAPLTALVAGFFFDELAALVEREVDPTGPPGAAMPLIDGLWLGARFAALSVIINLVALLLLLVPGVNAIAFLGANAYLLGRLYFELAALRFRPLAQVKATQRRFAVRMYTAGLVLAGFVAIPLLNLLTPLFATAFMVRVHKRLMRENDL